MIDQQQTYTIHIDGRWSLEDLYVFPRNYEQVYFALEAVLPASDSATNDRIMRAFSSFPWQGGYSAVNFYNQLKYATSAKRRPVVASMKYQSPGWIEVACIVPIAVSVSVIVIRVAKTLDACNHTYNQIYSDMQKRKLLKIEVERQQVALRKDELELIKAHADSMAHLLGIGSAETIHKRTKNPLISLKILLSMYRRVRTLAKYQIKGKAHFEDQTPAN